MKVDVKAMNYDRLVTLAAAIFMIAMCAAGGVLGVVMSTPYGEDHLKDYTELQENTAALMLVLALFSMLAGVGIQIILNSRYGPDARIAYYEWKIAEQKIEREKDAACERVDKLHEG